MDVVLDGSDRISMGYNQWVYYNLLINEAFVGVISYNPLILKFDANFLSGTSKWVPTGFSLRSLLGWKQSIVDESINHLLLIVP